jgi:hypothetical protein
MGSAARLGSITVGLWPVRRQPRQVESGLKTSEGD